VRRPGREDCVHAYSGCRRQYSACANGYRRVLIGQVTVVSFALVLNQSDASMRAEILSYSRSRGLFAGISLEGTSLRPDDDATELIYGRRLTARQIITDMTVRVPASGQALVDVLQKRAPYNESGKPGKTIAR
jgi:Las17-binding protein actin regulator